MKNVIFIKGKQLKCIKYLHLKRVQLDQVSGPISVQLVTLLLLKNKITIFKLFTEIANFFKLKLNGLIYLFFTKTRLGIFPMAKKQMVKTIPY